MNFKPSLRVAVTRGIDADVRRFCLIALPLLFAALAEDVIEREPMRFDTPLLLWPHAHETPFFDQTMLFFTWIGGVRALVLGVLCAALLGWKQRRVAAAFLLSALFGASVLNVVTKAAFRRVRPNLWTSLSPQYDYGFPSGHSMVSCALALSLLMLIWHADISSKAKNAMTAVGIGFIFGVGLSRLYLGVHYPSDVAAGWALSGVWVALLWTIFRRNHGL